MTIDLGGIEEVVKVYSDDDPKDLAKEFCNKHGLGEDVMEIIEENIIENLN